MNEVIYALVSDQGRLHLKLKLNLMVGLNIFSVAWSKTSLLASCCMHYMNRLKLDYSIHTNLLLSDQIQKFKLQNKYIEEELLLFFSFAYNVIQEFIRNKIKNESSIC